ncbi:MAG: hypothetical protein WDM77_20675 [Steroidobacteraceae bacterium]
MPFHKQHAGYRGEGGRVLHFRIDGRIQRRAPFAPPVREAQRGNPIAGAGHIGIVGIERGTPNRPAIAVRVIIAPNRRAVLADIERDDIAGLHPKDHQGPTISEMGEHR